MVNPKVYSLQAEICQSMSHPSRIQIIHILFEGPKNVGELASLTELGQSTVSRHLAILKRYHLVNAERHGQEIIYTIANPKLIEICSLMRQVISEQLSSQSDLIKYTIPPEKH